MTSLTLVALIIGSLMVCDESRAELITFEDYPTDTVITNQYQHLGVIFEGDPYPPIIYPPFWTSRPNEPALMGADRFAAGDGWGSYPFSMAFVDPTDGTPVDASNVGFYYYWLMRGIECNVVLTYFDAAGNLVRQVNLVETGNPLIPSRFHRMHVNTYFCSGNYFHIDDLIFQLPLLKITQPKVNDIYSLTQETYTKTTDIIFEATRPGTTGTVNWTAILYYATSGNRGQYTVVDTFSSPLNSTTTRAYQSKGGRLTVEATSGTETARPVQYAYIVGVPISPAEITSRLLSLYRGTTPDLLTKIAMVESTYRQFASRTLFGVTQPWPVESGSNGGAYIGLMQVPLSMANAWDWLVNTQAGADIFAEKLRITRYNEREFRKQYPGLRALTGLESENMSLLLYGGWAPSHDLAKQYYLPQMVAGKWEWVKNTMNNQGGVGYADKVRSAMHP